MSLKKSGQLFEFTWEDREYRKANDSVLLARIYKPKGKGPFPAVASIHGGAWTSGDRLTNSSLDMALASAGVVVAALDFGTAPSSPYPLPVIDVASGIQWLQSHASEFGSKTEWVGALGTSSGAHQMLLSILRPDFYRDKAEKAAAQHSYKGVPYAVACWPISDPLARYQMAIERENLKLVKAHQDYFHTESSMIEGNPQLILESKEHAVLPPLLLLQGTADDNVTSDMAQRFSDSYRASKGLVRLEFFSGQPHTFIVKEPDAPESLKAIQLIRQFVLRRGQLDLA